MLRGDNVAGSTTLQVTGNALVQGTLRAATSLAVGTFNVTLASQQADRLTTPNNFEVGKNLLVTGNVEVAAGQQLRFGTDTVVRRVGANQLRTDGALQVGGSAEVQGNTMTLGANAAFSITRPQATTSGRSTFILGQTAGAGNGGDVHIEAGAGTGTSAVAGSVNIGRQANSVDIGQAGKTTTVSGFLAVASDALISGVARSGSISTGGITSDSVSTSALTAASASFSSGISASALSVTNTAVVGSLSAQQAVTVAGSSHLVGSVLLGSTSLFTTARAPQPSAAGRSWYIFGQASGAVTAVGGDSERYWKAIQDGSKVCGGA